MSARSPFVILSSLLVAAAGACSDDPAGPAADPGSPDAGVVDPDAGVEAGRTDLGEKIDAAPGEWTWVPFPDSSCANGTPTGIGVNPGTSKRLVIFLEGGGACWSSLTCYALKTAQNIETGFGEADFESRISSVKGSILDRDDSGNVFKDASLVYVPYCTGDVHAGDREGTYDGKATKHVGRKNIEAYLKRIVATFDAPERVILSGSSAGGFGAAVNFWRVQEAFGKSIRVDLVDDSGPPFPTSKTKFFAEWNAAWDLNGALPPDCAACQTDLGATLPYYLQTYPSSRYALLSYTEDGVIRQFYQMSAPDFSAALEDLGTTTFDPSANARMFVVAGSEHTMLGNLAVETGGTSLSKWLEAMQSDDPSWSTKKP